MYFKLLLFLYIHTATGQPLTCEENQFKCMHRCIPISWRCDGDYDCVDEDDKTDEENCRKCDFFYWNYYNEMYSKQDTWDMFRGSLPTGWKDKTQQELNQSDIWKKMKYHLFRLLNIYKHVWFEKKNCLCTETFEQRKWEPLDIGRGIDQSDFSSVPSPYGYLNILDNLCVLCNVLRMIKKNNKLLGQAICVEIKRWPLQKKKSHTLQTCWFI